MPATSRSRRPRHSRAEWTRLVAEQTASGLSAGAFCAERDLGLRTFVRWKHKLSRAARASSAAAFVELPLPAPTPLAASPGWELELTLPDGIQLRLRRRAC